MNSVNETTGPSTTEKTCSATSSQSAVTEPTPPPSPLDQPRVDLTDKDPTQMTDQELDQWIRFCRDRRTANATALENKPTRRTSKSAAEDSKRETEKKNVMNSLLGL